MTDWLKEALHRQRNTELPNPVTRDWQAVREAVFPPTQREEIEVKEALRFITTEGDTVKEKARLSCD